MKSCIVAPVILVRNKGERSLSYAYNDRGYNISYPWHTLPYRYRRDLMYGASDELLRFAAIIFEEDPAQIRPRRLS